MEAYFYDPNDSLSTPTSLPDIHSLFTFYNSTFFSNVLDACVLKWSDRMTLCAGTCQYSSLNSCTIALSKPILQYRSHNDLKETLLHEMIHAYLFLTNPVSCKFSGGHGPEFQELAAFLNGATGLNITIYHNFHEEVENSRVHVWKCNGKCSEKPPFFGFVKRAVNRAPNIHDSWWKSHEISCGGTFFKVQGPEMGEKHEKSQSKEKTIGKTQGKRQIAKENRKITEFLKGKPVLIESFEKEEVLLINVAVLLENSEEKEVFKLLVSSFMRVSTVLRIICTVFQAEPTEISMNFEEIGGENAKNYQNFNENSRISQLFKGKPANYQDFLYKTAKFARKLRISLELSYDLSGNPSPLVSQARKSAKIAMISSESEEILKIFGKKLLNKAEINEKISGFSY